MTIHSCIPPVEFPYGSEMIDSIEIRNFRSFSQATISGCRRLNLIVGDNGRGKSALLESVFVASGPSPETALRTRAWRGMTSGVLLRTGDEIEDAVCSDLVPYLNVATISIVGLK